MSRLLNFTDAVVAIAVTLLILPILGLNGLSGQESIFAFIHRNDGLFFAFALSMMVVFSLWGRHHRMLDGICSYTPLFVGLNCIWLALLIVLQFDTQVLGLNQRNPGVLSLYWLTVFALSLTRLLQLYYLDAHPELLESSTPRAGHSRRLPVETAYMLFLAGLYWFAPGASLWFIAGLAVFPALDTWEALGAHRRVEPGNAP